MKKVLLLFLTMALWSCSDDSITTSSLDFDYLNSCFSPEFGITEDEQFFYDLVLGELDVNLDNSITTSNMGYSLHEGSKIVFVYRHLLENRFDIIDDEVEIRILFQIDEDLNSFTINNSDDFEKSNCIYAECGIALQSITGRINGNKISDGNWAIEANLNIERFNHIKEVNVNHIFKF